MVTYFIFFYYSTGNGFLLGKGSPHVHASLFYNFLYSSFYTSSKFMGLAGACRLKLDGGSPEKQFLETCWSTSKWILPLLYIFTLPADTDRKNEYFGLYKQLSGWGSLGEMGANVFERGLNVSANLKPHNFVTELKTVWLQFKLLNFKETGKWVHAKPFAEPRQSELLNVGQNGMFKGGICGRWLREAVHS